MTEQTTTSPAPQQMAPERFAELATAIESEVGRFIVGQHQLVRQTLISLAGELDADNNIGCSIDAQGRPINSQ